jgi:PAS domain S-box-containing protein
MRRLIMRDEIEEPSQWPEQSGVDALRALLSEIVESSDDAIISKTLDGVITSWNRAAEKIFGYNAVGAVGQSIRMIITPDRQAGEDYVLSQITQSPWSR